MKFLRTLSIVAAAVLAQVAPHIGAQSAGEDNLLPVEQAFVVSAKATARNAIALDWKVSRDYYLYRDRIKVTSSDAGVVLEPHALPAGEKKHDEYLGDVEVYHKNFSSTQKFTAPDDAKQLTLAVRYQGCHEVDPKICFPPHTAKLTIDLPAALASSDGPVSPEGASTERLLSIASADAPLPAEQAFVFEAITSDDNRILARFTMPKGYYLYRDETSFTLLDPTGIPVSTTKEGTTGISLGRPHWPTGVQHTDANFGTATVYFDQVDVPLSVGRPAGGLLPLKLAATFQGCRENSVCYPALTRTVNLTLPASEGNALSADEVAASTHQQARPASAEMTAAALLAALFGALIGGLVLNLMPCVLPVLSLKALSILEGGESPQAARRHVLFYTAGVLLSFAAVGLAVIVLRKAGLIYGWGFQLQQPLFVAILVYVIVAIGLSLSGVVQFGVGLTNAGQTLSARSGPAGDFFTGVLAVVVASPCTAPFMGSALAFAFANSAWVAFLIFIALGLGLALPFLLIGFVPALGRFLPKPGAWMDTLKQVLAFPMYLTAAWLIWVLGNQRGVDAIGLVLVGLVLLTLGLWWFERTRYDAVLWRSLALLALLLALPPLYAISGLEQKATTRADVSGQVAFNPAKLEALRASGKSVFVDIGADWCTTCKVNEHAVLATDAFRDLLKRTDTTLMVGDWTNPDPDIEAFLAQFKAVGVPLYVVFKDGDQGQALSTVLTQDVVRSALEKNPASQ